MIFSIIGIIIMIMAISDYHRAFLFFLIYKLFLVQNISVVNIPGVPLLTLDLLMTMFFIGLFWVKRHKLEYDNTPFFLKRPFIYIAIAYFISTIFAYIGFVGAVTQYAKDMCANFLMAWLIWLFVRKEDTAWIFKWMTVAFFFISLYGIYEHFTASNPLNDYEVSLMGDSDKVLDFTYGEDSGRGYRIKSVFEHAIGAGMMCGLYITFFVSLIMNRECDIKNKLFPIVTSILCMVCLFFTNSRGPILFLGISILGVVNLKNTKFYAACLVAVLAIYVLMPLLGDYADNVLSIFDSKAQERVGGSDANMRFEQLGAAIALMSQSPLVGLGYKFINVMDNVLVDMLLGGESMWFRILPCFGLLGIFVNLFLAFYEVIKIPRLFKSQSMFFLTTAYWVVGSLTSVPGYIMAIHYLVIFILIKQDDTYRELCKK